ncbi:hypothetical protein [Nonomuraea endophytica]|uniref:ParB/Sulfiredoxin domain-containing protein n=1 Tax=Nonomuraea endophytica TaxID=714136 RepID=A0A7W8EJB3_9ACTN|nr:hypothetical protein [Nonomuraea endophytica]MBB5081356.1 hypothetical protein [Nonomuraea endophytica]
MTASRYIEHMALASIPRAPRNPKDHDLEGIRAAIEQFGLLIAGELDDRTGRLVVGHGRLEVLETMKAERAGAPSGVQLADDGEWMVPILRGWESRSDADAEAYLIANNHLSEKGGWHEQGLADMLASIAAIDAQLLAATGYNTDDLADLEEALNADRPTFDEDDEPLPEPGDADEEDRPTVWGVVVTCENEDQQVELLQRMVKQGYKVRALM